MAVCCCFGSGSDPRWKVFYLRIGTGPSLLIPIEIEIGEIMSRNKPTGPQKGSVQKKVDWKALEIAVCVPASALPKPSPPWLES